MGNKDDIKTHFKTREGTYDRFQNFCSEDGKSQTSILATQSRSIVTVDSASFPDISKLSLSDSDVNHQDPNSLVFCTGKEVFHYEFQSDGSNHVDKRSYKGGALPSTIRISHQTASEDSLRVAIGFTAGQIQIIDMATRDDSRRSLTKINDEKNNDNTMITAIQWVPSMPNKLIAGYTSGSVYLFDTDKNDAPSLSWSVEKKCGKYFTQYQNRSKDGDNPEKKWSFGTAAISALEYSPCGRRLAVASRNGSCYVLANQEVDNKLSFNFLVEMNSYFGGFLCCSWSPSGRFLAAGGEDDLISVMNIENGRIICRCQGHRSWVASIAWDSFIDTSRSGLDSRLGSVGQDGILCFWDLTSDVMFPKRTRTFSESERIINSRQNRKAENCSGDTEISMLEPLIEKRISFDRLTYISFHPTCFIVATQDGAVVKWRRPSIQKQF